jgi:hypothetical protein
MQTAASLGFADKRSGGLQLSARVRKETTELDSALDLRTVSIQQSLQATRKLRLQSLNGISRYPCVVRI